MIDLFLLVILLICVITDVRSGKIYNKVIYPGLLAAFLFHFTVDGWEGISYSFIGFLIGFVLLLIPYMMKGMGAGDVKLLALVGALKGGTFVFESFIYMALIGGVISLFIILIRSGAPKSIVHFLSGLKNGTVYYPFHTSDALKVKFPYGIAIAGGTILAMLAERMPGIW
ncbi:prepilin peptidase [Domibacillus sp. PGB-M46]|uniref:A24 family peptidase n=1 Tax=Domibacillus sp. PGB-M46 TaxID=2910255 RepID=UPI001F599A2A|nr:prepilin peptidase [Domibacillus sp. PGB-M46]MCI2257071.1 prepilin peptidase [Domibacillus sp. PGB-M46]